MFMRNALLRTVSSALLACGLASYVAITALDATGRTDPAQAWALTFPLFLVGMFAGCLPVTFGAKSKDPLNRARTAAGWLLFATWLLPGAGATVAQCIAVASAIGGCWFALNLFSREAPERRRSEAKTAR